MKAILLSIQPKWVAKILNGEKTIEIRKSMPKCDLPIDVYIYCTTNKNNGTFLYDMRHDKPICRNGKVVAKFTLKRIFLVEYKKQADEYTRLANKLTCLTDEEIDKYLNGKNGYGWQISDLVIFDKPKELSEFKGACPIEKGGCRLCKYGGIGLSSMPLCRKPRLAKAPQSWCYIEGEIKKKEEYELLKEILL